MKVIRRAKRRIYSPRRDAWMRWQAAVSRFSKGMNAAVLQRFYAERDSAQRMADAFKKDFVDTLYAGVVRSEVKHLLAGDTRGPLRHVGTAKARIEWQGPPQNIPKPVTGAGPGAPEGDRAVVMVLSATDKPE